MQAEHSSKSTIYLFAHAQCAPRCCKLSILPPKNLNYIFCPRMLQAIVYPPSKKPLTWLRRRTRCCKQSNLPEPEFMKLYLCLHAHPVVASSLLSLQINLNIYLIAQSHPDVASSLPSLQISKPRPILQVTRVMVIRLIMIKLSYLMKNSW